MRRALSLLILVAAALCAVASPPRLPHSSPTPSAGYADKNTIERRIAKSGPHRIEGIWQFAQSGATIAIERQQEDANTAPVYTMTVVRSDNRAIKPGTLMGILTPSARSDKFDANIYTSSTRGSRLDSPKRFTLTLAEQGSRLVFERVKNKYSLNLWRMLPYMFRYAVRTNSNTGEAPLGCIKLFPAPAIPAEPRYL